MEKKKKLRALVTSSVLIALGTAISLVCEWIPGLNLPFGGTITICSLLPLVLISWMYGISWGLVSGFIYSLFQMLVGYTTVAGLLTPDSDSYMGIGKALLILLLDYILAFTVVGLGGMFRNWKSKTASLVCGALVSVTLCSVFHLLSGAIFYGAWAEWFFTDTAFAQLAVSKAILENVSGTALSILYSLVYNGCYMIPEIIITAIGAAAVSRLPAIKKEVR